MNSIQRLAKAHGIQVSYIAATGEERTTPEETLRRMLGILGVEDVSEKEAGRLLREKKVKAAASVVDSVHVLWDGKHAGVGMRLAGKSANLFIEQEDGETRKIGRGEMRAADRGGVTRLALGGLPSGYHKLIVESGGTRYESLLISAPSRVFDHPEEREWGLFAPLYAVNSEENWGAGNFSDWKRFTCWAAKKGAGVVSSLPVLASFLGKGPFEPSPYSPASRLFWNEFYVDVESVPEFQNSRKARGRVGSASFRKRLEAARAADLIDYRAGMELRREVLEILAEEFFASARSERRREFERFQKRRPEVKEYARFRASVEHRGVSWHQWEGKAREGVLRGDDFSRKTADYFAYCQWLADEQIERVLEACRERGVKFYLDLPLGVHPDSYDAWRYRDFFAQGVNAGAPPDAFFTKGQDWGFPPLHPERMRELHYSHVIDFLRFQIQHTGMLRLDHVMGLHRLYWVPQGRPASEGAYVTYPAEELYAILAVESHRHQCVLVGENLGTVPRETEKAMNRHRVRKMYVLQFEVPGGKELAGPKNNEVASLNTHDMPSFAAHWKGRDIADRVKLGLLPRAEAQTERKSRERWRKFVIAALKRSGHLGKATAPRDVLKAMLNFLAESEAPGVLVNMEDLWLEERPQNVPGTSTERPNWRRKAAYTLEEIESSTRVAALCDALQRKVKPQRRK